MGAWKLAALTTFVMAGAGTGAVTVNLATKPLEGSRTDVSCGIAVPNILGDDVSLRLVSAHGRPYRRRALAGT
jgi:hypothetical protein